MTIVCLLFQACRTGIPAIGEPGSNARGFTVSFAPITSVRSVSGKSSLISSISSTTVKFTRISLETFSLWDFAYAWAPLGIPTDEGSQCGGKNRKLTVVWHRCLGEQHVTLTRHAPGDRVDCEPHVDIFCPQHLRDFRDGVLGLRDGHAVANDDDDALSTGERL